jgi:hypothetical protein
MHIARALKLLKGPIPYGKTALLVLAVAGYWLLYWSALSSSPLGHDIDFDGDGNISLMEALDADALQTIAVAVNGRQCTEYVAPKDARTWRILCPK